MPIWLQLPNERCPAILYATKENLGMHWVSDKTIYSEKREEKMHMYKKINAKFLVPATLFIQPSINLPGFSNEEKNLSIK